MFAFLKHIITLIRTQNKENAGWFFVTILLLLGYIMAWKRQHTKIDFRGGYSPLPATISRLFNLFLALTLSIISLPVFLIISVVVRLQDSGPVLYKGIRLGINKKLFTMYKFRTLIPDAEKKIGDELLSHKHKMVTKSGRFLRDTRLDELPQLLNILKGDMDFIGPRPERPIIYEKYCKNIDGYDKRFSVRPGLIGYSQLFTPHGSTKKIRTLVDNRFLLKKRKLSWEVFIVIRTILIVLKIVCYNMISYIWENIFKRKVLRIYNREKRDLKRITICDGRAYIGEKTDDKQYVFTDYARIVDINEEAFLIYSQKKIDKENTIFRLEIEHASKHGRRRIKRKTAICNGAVYRESEINNNARMYSYIVRYTPISPFNAYIIDQYFLRKSIISHRLI